MLRTALLIFAYFVWISKCADFHTSLIIDELQSCPEDDVQKYFDLRNLTITLIDDQTFLNGLVIFTGEVPGDPVVKAIVTTEKCTHKNLPDTCEKLFDFVIKNICASWKKKGQIWTLPFSSLSPPFECKMKNNVYTVTNGTMDEELFKKTIPDAEKYYWKLKMKLYYNNQLRVCAKLACGYQRFPGKKIKKQ